jgi:4-hydroxy-2,2'-bipyrrole-5-carbaldehyde O-methyltransferase
VKLKPFLKLFQNHQLAALIGVKALLKPFYKLTYLAGAKSSGLLGQLAGRSLTFDELARTYATNSKSREALDAWLQLGLRMNLLNLKNQRYQLKGLALKLAEPQNDAALALLQEVATLHHKLMLYTPGKLKLDQQWSLADQDGELTTRSSRILEAFQQQAIDDHFPISGSTHLLEIGCGSAAYIKYAALRNPSLIALGLELQNDVAELAQKNVDKWGLQGRCRIETADIRERQPEQLFEIATLFNNIYYFPVAGRISLLAHIMKFIRPGGFLLLTTCCQGGSLGVEALNLWGAATANAGRLPHRQEMLDQLYAAGYSDVEVTSLIPGDTLYSFKAYVSREVGSRKDSMSVV